MMGWDENFLQQAVSTCTNLSGRVEDCPLFQLQADSVAGLCEIPLPKDVQHENVTGPGLTSLPGNLPVLDGTATTVPTVSYSPGHSATASGQYEPGDILDHTSSTILPTAQGAATVTSAPGEWYNAVSTQYVTASNVVSKIVWEEAVVYVTTEFTSTVYVTPTTTPTAAAASLAKGRRHMHRHFGRHAGRF